MGFRLKQPPRLVLVTGSGGTEATLGKGLQCLEAGEPVLAGSLVWEQENRELTQATTLCL